MVDWRNEEEFKWDIVVNSIISKEKLSMLNQLDLINLKYIMCWSIEGLKETEMTFIIRGRISQSQTNLENEDRIQFYKELSE